MEKAPKPEGKRNILEWLKNAHGWLMAAGVVTAVFVPVATVFVAAEGAHIGAINYLEDEIHKRKQRRAA